MATSGSVYSSYAVDSRFRVDWTRTAVSIPNNTSTIKWTLYLVSDDYWYSNAIRINSIYINGVKVKGEQTWSNYKHGTFELASGSTTITHNNDGTKSFTISLSGWFYSNHDVSGSDSFTLDTIPRYATISQSLSSRTETSLTILWTADATCDYLWYSTDGGDTFTDVQIGNATTGTYTITGLSIGTTYEIVTKVRRKDSQLSSQTQAQEISTYPRPYANVTPDFMLGSALTVGIFNPLSKNLIVDLLDCNNTAVGQVVGTLTEARFTNIQSALYASIPNATSGQYKVRVTSGSDPADIITVNGGYYSVNPNDCVPEIGTVAYQDTNQNVQAVVQDDQKILQNLSTVLYTASSMVAKNSATLASVSVAVNGNTYGLTINGSSASGGNATIDSTSAVEAVFTLTDSRGFSTQKTIEVDMMGWSLPTALVSVGRVSNFYSTTDMKVDADYSSIDGKNTITITYRGKAVPQAGKTTPADVTGTLTDNVTGQGVFDNDFAWNITFTLTDAFQASSTYSAYISRGIPIIFFDRLRRSMSINGFPQHDESFEIDGDIYSNDVYINGVKIVDLIYPVGSIYLSVNAVDPATLFGGTWVQIKDTFLLASGDDYTVGDTGGETEHALTVDEMPSHDHFQQFQSDTSYVGIHVKNYNTGGSIQGVQPANGTRRNNIMAPAVRVSTVATGGGQAHNNLPPYLAVNVWKRTA